MSGSGFGPTILEVGLRGHLTHPLTPASKPGLSFWWCEHMLSLHKSSGSIQNIGVSSLPEELLWGPRASKGTGYSVLKDTSLENDGSEMQLHPMRL